MPPRLLYIPLTCIATLVLLLAPCLPASAGSGARTAVMRAGTGAGPIYLTMTTEKLGYGKSDAMVLARSQKQFAWGLTWGSASSDYASAIALDAGGNIYVTGSTPFAVRVSDTQGNVISPALTSAFLLKISPSGSLLWAKTYGWSNNNLNIEDVVVGANGDIFMGGSAYRMADETNDVAFSGAVLACCDANGEPKWGGGWSTDTLGEAIHALDVDQQGNVYAVGQGSQDNKIVMLLLSYSPTGELRWVRHASLGFDCDCANAVKCAPDGLAYVAAAMGVAQFPDPRAPNLLTRTNTDALLLSVDQQGEVEFISRIGGPYEDMCTTLALDETGSIWAGGFSVKGYWDNPKIANADDIREALLINVDPRRDQVWAGLLNASQNGRTSDQAVTDLMLGRDGTVIITANMDANVQELSTDDAAVESLAATGWVHEPQGEALTPKFSAFSADTKEYRALTVDRDSALAEFDRQRLGCFGGPILPAGGNNAP